MFRGGTGAAVHDDHDPPRDPGTRRATREGAPLADVLTSPPGLARIVPAPVRPRHRTDSGPSAAPLPLWCAFSLSAALLFLGASLSAVAIPAGISASGCLPTREIAG